MQVKYKNRKLEVICTNAAEAQKKYSEQMAELIHERIDQLSAFDTVEMLIRFKIGRCHPLKGQRKEQYAMDLVHPFRLIFEKHGTDIQIAFILEITDYH